MIATRTDEVDDGALLDLFSTSAETVKKCIKNAPYICIPGQAGIARLYQGCCNDWTCPRCGEKRAKREYGRMVQGAREIAANRPLFMMTITCRGDVAVKESEENYLDWTHHFHKRCQDCCKYFGMEKPEYAAVIERQERGHLHTHYLTTFAPLDWFYIVDDYERYCRNVEILNRGLPKNMRFSPEKLKDIDHRQAFSMWLVFASVQSGLGAQVRIAIADVVEGASRYMAKYLFKAAQFTRFPKGLKRVRYSQGWPKLPEVEATSAFAVLKQADWTRVKLLDQQIECFGRDVFDRAANHLIVDAFYVDNDGNRRGVECL